MGTCIALEDLDRALAMVAPRSPADSEAESAGGRNFVELKNKIAKKRPQYVLLSSEDPRSREALTDPAREDPRECPSPTKSHNSPAPSTTMAMSEREDDDSPLRLAYKAYSLGVLGLVNTVKLL